MHIASVFVRDMKLYVDLKLKSNCVAEIHVLKKLISKQNFKQVAHDKI